MVKDSFSFVSKLREKAAIRPEALAMLKPSPSDAPHNGQCMNMTCIYIVVIYIFVCGNMCVLYIYIHVCVSIFLYTAICIMYVYLYIYIYLNTYIWRLC